MRKLNNIAADMIPIRLIISIAIIAAISVLMASGFFSFGVTVSENNIQTDVNYLISNLDTMVASGVARDMYQPIESDGTKRTISFDFADNVIYVGFGVDPDPDNDGILESGLTGQGNVIFYKVSGSSKKVIWLDSEIKFREGSFDKNKWIIHNSDQGFIVKNGGKVTITFELVKRFNDKYILIHATDNF